MVLRIVQHLHEVFIRRAQNFHDCCRLILIFTQHTSQQLFAQSSPASIAPLHQKTQLRIRYVRIFFLNQLFQDAAILKDGAPAHQCFQLLHRLVVHGEAVLFQVIPCAQACREFSRLLRTGNIILRNIRVWAVLPKPLRKHFVGNRLVLSEEFIQHPLFQLNITNQIALYADAVQLIQHEVLFIQQGMQRQHVLNRKVGALVSQVRNEPLRCCRLIHHIKEIPRIGGLGHVTHNPLLERAVLILIQRADIIRQTERADAEDFLPIFPQCRIILALRVKNFRQFFRLNLVRNLTVQIDALQRQEAVRLIYRFQHRLCGCRCFGILIACQHSFEHLVKLILCAALQLLFFEFFRFAQVIRICRIAFCVFIITKQCIKLIRLIGFHPCFQFFQVTPVLLITRYHRVGNRLPVLTNFRKQLPAIQLQYPREYFRLRFCHPGKIRFFCFALNGAKGGFFWCIRLTFIANQCF